MNLELARKNLSSLNPNLVSHSLRLFAAYGKLSDLQSIMTLFKHPNPAVKKAAVETTTQIIRENLISHFNELELGVRQKLGILLQSLDPMVIDELSKDLFCETEDRRLRAVQILGLLHRNPRVREVLARLVQDKNVKVRATAVNLLGKVIGQNDHDVILWLLNDTDKRVRANTIEALESTGNKRLVPILLRFRKDPNNRIRGNVIKALFSLGFVDIEDDLLEMINDSSVFMKASALWVISQIKLKKRCLEDAAGFCLLSENEMVRSNALKALTTLDTPRARGYMKYLEIPTGLFQYQAENSQ